MRRCVNLLGGFKDWRGRPARFLRMHLSKGRVMEQPVMGSMVNLRALEQTSCTHDFRTRKYTIIALAVAGH